MTREENSVTIVTQWGVLYHRNNATLKNLEAISEQFKYCQHRDVQNNVKQHVLMSGFNLFLRLINSRIMV